MREGVEGEGGRKGWKIYIIEMRISKARHEKKGYLACKKFVTEWIITLYGCLKLACYTVKRLKRTKDVADKLSTESKLPYHN